MLRCLKVELGRMLRFTYKKGDGVSAKSPPDEATRREHRPEMSSLLMLETVKAALVNQQLFVSHKVIAHQGPRT